MQAFFLVPGAARRTPHALVRDKRLEVAAVRKTNEGVVEAHKRFLADPFNLNNYMQFSKNWLSEAVRPRRRRAFPKVCRVLRF